MKLIFLNIVTFHISRKRVSSDLASLLNNIHSMRATFIQTTYDNYNKPIQKSYGRMALQRPGKFRWEVTKPIPQIIIANAKTSLDL